MKNIEKERKYKKRMKGNRLLKDNNKKYVDSGKFSTRSL